MRLPLQLQQKPRKLKQLQPQLKKQHQILLPASQQNRSKQRMLQHLQRSQQMQRLRRQQRRLQQLLQQLKLRKI
jgi:hypothetical protein